MFNDQIQLLHVASKQLIKVSGKTNLSRPRKSDEMKSYSLTLCEFSSSETHFRILPSRDFQDNCQIMVSDSFFIGFEQKEPLARTFTLWFNVPDELPQNSPKGFICYLYDGLKEKIKFGKEQYIEEIFGFFN